MHKIGVLLVEDHTIVRKGLRALLEGEMGIQIVGEAEDGIEAIRKAEKVLPDIVVLDIGMPGLNGLEVTRRLKKSHPDMKIIILTAHSNEEYVLETLRSGASGYMLKKTVPADLITAVLVTYRGESFLSPSISRTVIDGYLRKNGKVSERDEIYGKLTNREREVLQLIAEGHKTREIAEILYVSVKTIETHRANIMDKLGVRSIAGLTQYALRLGLIIHDPLAP